MSGFSEDGQWWWDGAAWVATDQVVLPDLPATEFERSGRLKTAQVRAKNVGVLYWPNEVAATWFPFSALAFLTGIPLMVMYYRSWRDVRMLTLQQLALATAFLLGPDEPMLAGEGTRAGDSFSPDLAVAITTGHVLVMRTDQIDQQPRRVVLARSPGDVVMVARHGPLGLGSFLEVTTAAGRWRIRGMPGAFEPGPVLDAWRAGAARATRAV